MENIQISHITTLSELNYFFWTNKVFRIFKNNELNYVAQPV